MISKRIGLDLRFYRRETGGIGRYSRNLLLELLQLDTSNHYTAILTPADEAEFTLRADNLKKLVVPISHYSMTEQCHLPKILNAEQFDLVHFTNFNHPLLYRRRFIVTVHDLIMHLHPTGAQKNSTLRRIAYKLVINDCRRAAKIIVPSLSTKNDLVRMLGFPSSKVVITPEGSESVFRRADPALVTALRHRLQLPERYLLFVSRWEEYKGLLKLVEAHKILSAEFPELGLVIAGKPDKQNPAVVAQIEAAKAAGQKIITPGFVSDEDLVPLYTGASVYVHPSLYEGFGIMILEAMACGAPVVTSNVSSLPEVAGEAALLVDPRSVSEIAAAIKRLLTNPALADELRERGFKRVKQFSWQKMAKQTLEVYRQLLAP